ncbi:MAG TPA: hypothetical protein VM368_04870 [Flavisolibacter sp.]|nr:hypothetical protein [Flavisolibacter sp.]
MKFLFVILTVLCSINISISHAGDVKVSPIVLHSFNSSFKDAAEVKWSISSKLYKAEFNFNEQYVTAYFDESGTMVAAIKNISSFQLPLSLQKSLKKELQSYWITELFELNNDSGTNYYLTLENAETKLVLKSTGAFDWHTFQRQRKS